MNMKEDFVSYNIAVKLKEKGYPQVKKDSLAMYNQDGEWFSLASNLDTFEYSFEDFDDRDCVCPTIFQVLKWLREEKKLYVVPLICSDWSEDADGIICDEWLFWSYRVFNINDGRIVYDELDKIDNGNFENYIQAALAGIEYILDNFI